MKPENEEIVKLLRKIAAAHIIKRESRFRIAAYEKAADAIEQLSKPVVEVWKEGKLDEIPGIGSIITGSLDEYFKTGKVKHFKFFLRGIPETVFELMKIPTLGPLRAYKLAKTFKLKNVSTVYDDLLALCEANKIAVLPTFGPRSQQVLIDAIKQRKNTQTAPERIPYGEAHKIAQEIIDYLKKNKHVKRVDAMGSLRRKTETIGDVDIAVIADKASTAQVIKYFTDYPKKLSVNNAGDKKASIILPPHLRIDLRVQDKEGYGSMLQYFTGSKAHNIQLRELALSKGYTLNEWGIKNLKTGKLYTFDTEEKLYNFLGLHYIKPEDRQGTFEIEKAVI